MKQDRSDGELDSRDRTSIRLRVQAAIEQIKAGKFTTYEGRAGLKDLAESVKRRGRELLNR